MTKKERDFAFDLGRLCVLIDQVTEHELFEQFEKFSKHYDVEEYLEELPEEKRSDWLHDLRFWVASLYQKLWDCVSIAQGTDSLNDPKN